MAEPLGAFHSRPVLATVVVCHLLAGFALFQLLDRARLPMPAPITVSLITEPLPESETPPQALPQAAAPPPVRQAPKVAAAPPPPPPAPEPAPVRPQPEIRPEPPPIRQAEPVPEPAPVPPPVRQAEPRLEPVPVPPAPPAARVEPDTAIAVRPPEPVRAAPAPVPPPVAQAPAPVAEAAPATEPLYGADYLNNPKPTYPLMSRRMGEQGVVLLRVFVTAEGDPREVLLKEGSGYPRLDRAAQEVVQRWKFVPAKRGSRPVDAWVVVPIRFSLKG